jgi:hypothetical protein
MKHHLTQYSYPSSFSIAGWTVRALKDLDPDTDTLTSVGKPNFFRNGCNQTRVTSRGNQNNENEIL